MGRRAELHELLKTVLGSGNVYFQPPESLKMEFPAIVYQRDGDESDFADNKHYRRTVQYQVTVIAKNPDHDVVDKVAELPLCRHQAWFARNQLNHDVFRLFF